MKSLDNLLIVCNKYKRGEFNIKEFQSRILTSNIPESLSKEFLDFLVKIDNRIEKLYSAWI